MSSENFIKQAEEIEALYSIYGDEFISDTSSSCGIKIKVNNNEAILYITMPPKYPQQEPPNYELSAPWMDRITKQRIHNALDEVYLHYVGESVLFQWAERIREMLLSIKPMQKAKIKNGKKKGKEIPKHKEFDVRCPTINTGEAIADRKSTFQAHAAEVHSIDDVKIVLSKLKENKKIMNATHNIYAYRIEGQNGKLTQVQDYEDDGESQAGSRLMHLLQILDLKNTLVVVTRWRGSIQLGPDRFRHYNNAARKILKEAGMLNVKK